MDFGVSPGHPPSVSCEKLSYCGWACLLVFFTEKKRKEKEKEVGEGKECERRDLRKYGGKERLNDCRSSEVVVVVSKQWTRSDARANRS